MKIRTGFVSNSSSSSFVLLGVKLDDEVKGKLSHLLKEPDSSWYDVAEELDLAYEFDKYEVIGTHIIYGDIEEPGCFPMHELLNDPGIQKLLKLTGKGAVDLVVSIGNSEC